jgi:hypothetical protein
MNVTIGYTPPSPEGARDWSIYVLKNIIFFFQAFVYFLWRIICTVLQQNENLESKIPGRGGVRPELIIFTT